VRRGLVALIIAVVAAAACVGLVSALAARDSGGVSSAPSGPGVLEPDRGGRRLGADAPQHPASPPNRPPTSGPYRPATIARDQTPLSDDQILTALAAGNVVIAYDRTPPLGVQREVSGPFDPSLAAAGQAVILDHRPGVGGVQALAWRRRLVASGVSDPRLREFAEAWLGQGLG
jgi:Protein of unknown function (DUF3105)